MIPKWIFGFEASIPPKLDTTFYGGGGGGKSLCVEGFELGEKELMAQQPRASDRRPVFNPTLVQLLGEYSTWLFRWIWFPTVCSCSPPLKKAKLCVSACLSACLLARLLA